MFEWRKSGYVGTRQAGIRVLGYTGITFIGTNEREVREGCTTNIRDLSRYLIGVPGLVPGGYPFGVPPGTSLMYQNGGSSHTESRLLRKWSTVQEFGIPGYLKCTALRRILLSPFSFDPTARVIARPPATCSLSPHTRR
eukprot:2302224-Rhodomonas_salina.1